MKVAFSQIKTVILSLIFFLELLALNIRDSNILWIINTLIILITIKLLRSQFKNINFFYCLAYIFLWIIIELIALFNDPSLAFNKIVQGNLFLISTQIPFLGLLLFYFIKEKSKLKTFSNVNWIIGIILFLGLKLGWIPDYKYQIIGNICLFGIILLGGVLKNYNSPWTKIQIFSLVMTILLVGSRQSFLGLLIYFIMVVFNEKRRRIYIGIPITFFFILLLIILSKKNSLEEFNYENFTTISRIISNISLESNSNRYRINSNSQLISNTEILPNGYEYLNDIYFYEPHNFILETLFVKGFILGGLLLFISVFVYIYFMLKVKEKILNQLVVIFLIPANVSYGLHAARFMMISIICCLLFIGWNNTKKLENA